MFSITTIFNIFLWIFAIGVVFSLLVLLLLVIRAMREEKRKEKVIDKLKKLQAEEKQAEKQIKENE